MKADGLLTEENPNYPIFTPSLEELENFEEYILFLESKKEAHKAGVAKIIPPGSWNARKQGYNPSKLKYRVTTVVQKSTLASKVTDAFMIREKDSGYLSSLEEFFNKANSKKYLPPSDLDAKELEEIYWQQVTTSSQSVYRAQSHTSFMDLDQSICNPANLDSILHDVSSEACQPCISIGMWMATRSWQTEDMDLYSLNYLHYGDSKTWYFIPPEYGYKLEQVARKIFPNDHCFNQLRHKDIMISPALLEANLIPVHKVIQEQGTFLIIFPHTHFSGFDHGFNIMESARFATFRWIEYGKRFRDCLCSAPVKTLKLQMDRIVQKYQSEVYESWLKGEDLSLHPEDPVFIKRYWVDIKTRLRLGFIQSSQFELLAASIREKREIVKWFEEKFPSLDYDGNFDLVYINRRPTRQGLNIQEEKSACRSTKKEVGNNNYIMMKTDENGKTMEVSKSKIPSSSGFKGKKFAEARAKINLFQCPSNKKHKLRACKKCSGCLKSDCNVCNYCLDKPKNGGKLVLKQKCKEKLCENPKITTCSMCESEG